MANTPSDDDPQRRLVLFRWLFGVAGALLIASSLLGLGVSLGQGARPKALLGNCGGALAGLGMCFVPWVSRPKGSPLGLATLAVLGLLAISIGMLLLSLFLSR